METESVRSIEIKAENAKSISEIVRNWWKEVSSEQLSIATPGKLYAIGNYLIELTKNSFGAGKSDGKITVSFDDEKIKIVIDDLGTEEKEINLNVAGEYGMKEAIEYFDIFMIESRRRKYEKNYKNIIEETDDSEINKGSRVTIIKYHVKPVDEFEEEYHSKRKFGEWM